MKEDCIETVRLLSGFTFIASRSFRVQHVFCLEEYPPSWGVRSVPLRPDKIKLADTVSGGTDYGRTRAVCVPDTAV